MAAKKAEFFRATEISIGVIGFATHQCIKVQQPFFAESPNVQIDAIKAPMAPTESEPSLSTRGVKTISGADITCSAVLFHVVVELIIVFLPSGQRLFSPAEGML